METTKRLVVPAAEEILGLYFPVLDHGFVALKDYMGGDETIEKAARTSYTLAEEVRKIAETRQLIRYLYAHEHMTPFEQAESQYHIAMPIFVMRQWVRHRASHLNEYSGRYSPMPLLYYTPDNERVCSQSKSNKQGRDGPIDPDQYEACNNNRERTRQSASLQYRTALKIGVAKETARIDLPLSTYTYVYWKCDMRNLLHLIGLRSDPHAQWEIRQYADVIAGIVQRLCPLAFAAFQDYQQDAVTFTQAEMAAIRTLAHYHVSPVSWNNPSLLVRSAVEEVLIDRGCTKREVSEFWSKLGVREKRDYSLDLSTARDGEYYRNLIAEHAVEMPAD